MKRTAGFLFAGIFLGVAILPCGVSFAWTEETSLVWENVSHHLTKGESISRIADEAKMTPTALLFYNYLQGYALKPNTTIFIPKILQIAALHSERILGNPNVKSYQIYSADRKCYAMVYAVAKTDGDDEQFLAVFAFEGKYWVETDRITFNHPVKLNLKHQMKLLPSDEVANEGCSFFLKSFSCFCNGYDADGIVHAPAISQHLHGIRLKQRDIRTRKKKDVEVTSYDMYGKIIGSVWPDRLLYFRENIVKNLYRLQTGFPMGKNLIYWE